MSDVAKIFIAVAVLVVCALVLGVVIALVSTKFKVKEDNRIKEVTKLLPGANCGGCGYPGCSGLASALVSKEVNKVSACKVIKQDKAQAVIDYLANTEGPDGQTIKVTY